MQGVAAALNLVAILGGTGTALMALWLKGSLLQDFLAYLIGGLGFITLTLAICWARAKPTTSGDRPPVSEPETAGSLVFQKADTDLENRVNVNRSMRRNTPCVQFSGARRRWPSLAAQLLVGLSFLLALVAIDQA
jgi:hypothetical protein